MWRYLVGLVGGLVLAVGGVALLRPSAFSQPPGRNSAVQPGRASTPVADDAGLPEPPAASEKTREEKRFSRYDKDKDGKIAREEYLAARRKAFAKLDKNGDGKLDFDEWAVKAETKFADADKSRDGSLTAAEFAVTRPVRKAKPRVVCPPTATGHRDDDEG